MRYGIEQRSSFTPYITSLIYSYLAKTMDAQETLRPTSPRDRAMATLTPVGTGSRAATVATVEEGYQRPRQNSLTPTLTRDHTGIYWHAPAKMIFFFLFGLACCIAHYLYYRSQDGGQVPSQVDQQWALRSVVSLSLI
jgi:hypothetical protein